MDDYSMSSLNDSKNEWCSRLLNILTPCIIVEITKIFKEACRECEENDEEDKYLMTFQVFLSGIPKWSKSTVEEARRKITEKCKYLEEMITCVHLIQLKALTCVRVCQKQKKVDIDIPSVDNFIHKVFSNVARRLYTNIYLFEKNIAPLQIQKHNRELELIIKECILNTVRETMPIEAILRAYMDETEDQSVDVKEEVVEETVQVPVSNNVEKSGGKKEKSNDKSSQAQAQQTQQASYEQKEPAHAPAPAPEPEQRVVEQQIIKKPVEIEPLTNVTIVPPMKQTKGVGFSDVNEEFDYNGKHNIVPADTGILKIGGEVKLDNLDVNDLNINNTVSVKPPLIDIDVETLPDF
jgi:hypothetical protein